MSLSPNKGTEEQGASRAAMRAQRPPCPRPADLAPHPQLHTRLATASRLLRWRGPGLSTHSCSRRPAPCSAPLGRPEDAQAPGPAASESLSRSRDPPADTGPGAKAGANGTEPGPRLPRGAPADTPPTDLTRGQG